MTFINKSLLFVFGLLLICPAPSLQEAEEPETNPSVVENGLPGPLNHTNIVASVIHGVRVMILGVYGNINGFIDKSINFFIRIPQKVFFMLTFVPKMILKVVSHIPVLGRPAGAVVANLENCQKRDLAKNFGKVLLDKKNCLVKPVTSIVRDSVTILQKMEEIALAFSSNPESSHIKTFFHAISTSLRNAIPIVSAVLGLLPHLIASIMHLPVCIAPTKTIVLVKEAFHYVGQYFKCIV